MRSEPTGDTRAVSVRASLKRHSCSRSVTVPVTPSRAGGLAEHLVAVEHLEAGAPSLGRGEAHGEAAVAEQLEPSPTAIAKVSTSSRGTIVASIGSAPSGNGGVVGEPVGGGLAAVAGVGVVVLEPGEADPTVGARRRLGLPARLVREVGAASVGGGGRGGGSPRRRSRAVRDDERRRASAATATRPPAAQHRPATSAPRDRPAHLRAGRPADQRGGRRPPLRARVEHGLEPLAQRRRQRARDRAHLALRGPHHQQLGGALAVGPSPVAA